MSVLKEDVLFYGKLIIMSVERGDNKGQVLLSVDLQNELFDFGLIALLDPAENIAHAGLRQTTCTGRVRPSSMLRAAFRVFCRTVSPMTMWAPNGGTAPLSAISIPRL